MIKLIEQFIDKTLYKLIAVSVSAEKLQHALFLLISNVVSVDSRMDCDSDMCAAGTSHFVTFIDSPNQPWWIRNGKLTSVFSDEVANNGKKE